MWQCEDKDILLEIVKQIKCVSIVFLRLTFLTHVTTALFLLTFEIKLLCCDISVNYQGLSCYISNESVFLFSCIKKMRS